MEDRCTPDRCQECQARVVCHCLQVTEDVLREALSTLPIRSLNDLRQLTGVGDACLACHPQLHHYLEEIASPPTVGY